MRFKKLNWKIPLGFAFSTCMLLILFNGIVQTQTAAKAQVVFASNRGGNWDIYVMEADGKKLRRLTGHSADDWQPAWSHDGKRIAFVSNRDNQNRSMDIYIMDADGKSQRNFTKHPANDVEAHSRSG